MITLHHPTIAGMTTTVTEDVADRWRAAGWVDPETVTVTDGSGEVVREDEVVPRRARKARTQTPAGDDG